MVAGATILGIGGCRLTPQERRLLARADPWGFILFARNVENPDQLRALTAELRAAVGREAPIFIDQEGGRVARLRAPHWREWPPALDDADGAADRARVLWLRYRIIAEELRAVGIDGNCAPLADIAGPATHPILLDRCYGRTLATVRKAARAVADALLAGGVLPVLKHIPGHGRPHADSHLELPRTDLPLTELRATDFAAFRALSDLPIGMTAHVLYSALDDRHPATLSRAVIEEIRTGIGFAGLLMTDDISMQALSGGLTERTRAALEAGCDVILHCNGDASEMAEVAEAAEALTPVAAARAEAALAFRKLPDPIDIAALSEEYAAQLA